MRPTPKTVLRIDHSTEIGSLYVPTSVYTLYMWVDPENSKLIVNRQVGQSHNSYDSGQDLGRVGLIRTDLDNVVDQLTFSVEEASKGRERSAFGGIELCSRYPLSLGEQDGTVRPQAVGHRSPLPMAGGIAMARSSARQSEDSSEARRWRSLAISPRGMCDSFEAPRRLKYRSLAWSFERRRGLGRRKSHLGVAASDGDERDPNRQALWRFKGGYRKDEKPLTSFEHSTFEVSNFGFLN